MKSQESDVFELDFKIEDKKSFEKANDIVAKKVLEEGWGTMVILGLQLLKEHICLCGHYQQSYMDGHYGPKVPVICPIHGEKK